MLLGLRIKVDDFILLIFYQDGVSLHITLKFVYFHLERGLLSLWLFLFEVVDLLKLNDLLFERFHLYPEFFDAIEHLNLVLCNFTLLMMIDLYSLEFCHQLGIQQLKGIALFP